MKRERLTKRTILILVAALLAVGSSVWLANRTPREPVYQGHKLSWWFVEGIDRQANPNFQRLTKDELQSLGPGALEWLSSKVEQTSIWDSENRIIGWVRSRSAWDPGGRFNRIRFESFLALEELGPDAVPAIPSLLKAVNNADAYTRRVAVETLFSMRPASWPAIVDSIRHGNKRTRDLLVQQLDLSAMLNSPSADPRQFAELVDLLVPLAAQVDGGDVVKGTLNDCCAIWARNPLVAEGVRLAAESLARRSSAEQRVLARFLSDFDTNGAAAVPALAALAETSDQTTRVEILGALCALDPDNARWPATLYELVASPNKELSEAAERALIHAGK